MGKLKLSFPSLQQPGLVSFGRGCINVLADANRLSGSVFFLSGEPHVREIVSESLRKRGKDLGSSRVIVKPAGEPTRDMIDQGAELLREYSYDRIVGIGGGSVMDWCRLVCAQVQGSLSWDSGRCAVRDFTGPPTELWLIPTTCGTGAEAATVVVFSDAGRKVPVVSPRFLANRVLLDAQFLDHVTPNDMANSVCDALSHAIEGFVSIVPCYLAKEMSISTVQLILEHFLREPSPSRNERLLEAGYLGGVVASHCSVGVVHAFAHTMAAYGVSHRHGNALGLTAGILSNAEVPAMRDLIRRCGMISLDQFIRQVGAVVQAALRPEEDARVRRVLRDESSREHIIQQMAEDGCLRTNPRSLDSQDLSRFLDAVIAISGAE